MERKEYKYREEFSQETNKNMAIFHNISEDCREILGGNPAIDLILGRIPSPTSDEQVIKLSEYGKRFLSESNLGILRTFLVHAKPFRNHPSMKDLYSELAKHFKY